MVDFGIVTIPVHYSLQPAELGMWAEAHGFESVRWVPTLLSTRRTAHERRSRSTQDARGANE